MQNKIVLNPAYKGPIIIEEYLRKMKSQSSLGRIISTYNKRFFILDFKRMLFYYLPERGSQLSNATDIPLDSITRIYIDSQLQLLDDDQIWKHGFVILSGKRSYRLISHSQANMENLLYGFAHLINNETKQPLFDWNEYRARIQTKYQEDGIEPPKPQIFSPAGTISETQTGPNSSSSVSQPNSAIKKKKSSDEIEKPAPVRRSSQTESPDKGRQDEVSERPRVPERKASKPESAEKNNENPEQEPVPRKDSKPEQKKNVKLEEEPVVKPAPQKQQLNVREVDKVDVCESQMIMENESVHVNASEREHHRRDSASPSHYDQPKERKLQTKVEALSVDIDPLETYVPTNNNYPTSTRSRRLIQQQQEDNQSERFELNQGITPKNRIGGFNPYVERNVKQNSSEEEFYKPREIVQNEQDKTENWGVPRKNEEIRTNKAKSDQNDNDWDRKEVSVKKENVYKTEKKVEDDDDWDKDMESPPKKNVKSNVQSIKRNDDDWDRKEVPMKKENVYKAEKKIEDDDDWDKDMESPPKKNVKSNVENVKKYNDNGWDRNNDSLSKKNSANIGVKPQTHNMTKKVNNNDDDWDNDMFGDNDRKPQNNRFEIKSDAKYKETGSFGKPAMAVEHNFKQNAVPVTKTAVHNDWDDDL